MANLVTWTLKMQRAEQLLFPEFLHFLLNEMSGVFGVEAVKKVQKFGVLPIDHSEPIFSMAGRICSAAFPAGSGFSVESPQAYGFPIYYFTRLAVAS